MIEFREIYSVEHCALRYYISEDGKYRFVPIDRKNYTDRIYGYVVTPSGVVFPDTFDIWEQYDIEFILWANDEKLFEL